MDEWPLIKLVIFGECAVLRLADLAHSIYQLTRLAGQFWPMAPKVTVLGMLLFLVSKRELQQGDMNKNSKITDQKDTCWIFLFVDSSTKWICFSHLVYSKLLHKQFFHCSKLSTLVLIKAFHASNLEFHKK